PGQSPVKRYLPYASVVLVLSTVLPLSNCTVTPEIPISPASWIPLLLVSFQTKSPICPLQVPAGGQATSSWWILNSSSGLVSEASAAITRMFPTTLPLLISAQRV